MPDPPLAVYLIHWNAPRWCADAVRSVRASVGVAVSVIVVDNGQTHDPALREVLPSDVRVLSTGANLGYTGAANLAVDDWLTAGSTPSCVIASHDLHVAPDCLAKLVGAVAEEHAAGESRLALVAPAIVKSPVCWGGEWTGSRSRRLRALRSNEEGLSLVDRDWVPGTCMMIGRSFAMAHKPLFDTRLGSYHEDVDVCLSARAAGWRVALAPAAHAWGIGSESQQVSYWTDRNGVIVAAKHARFDQLLTAITALGARFAGTAVTSALPTRSRAARAESRRYTAQHARALHDLWTLRGLLVSLRRERRSTRGTQSSPKRASR